MISLRRFFLSIVGVWLVAMPAQATTWNEPWHREVVSAATSFGLYEVVQSTPDAVTLKRVKHLAGEETGADVVVDAFYALALTSQSAGHGPALRLPAGTRAYFHLKRTGKAWAIATPSAGYAVLRSDGKVAATYRISMHQALVEAPLYEDTQVCIFLALHRQACDRRIGAFIDAELAKPVELMTDASTNASLAGFFRQHVALETASLMPHAVAGPILERFLSAPGMHVQMAALRVLAASPRPDRARRLMQFVEDDKANMSARILAATLLQETGAHEMKQRLRDYAVTASEQDAGLGIALIDPRIGTRFPDTLRAAVKGAADRL